MVKIYDMGMLVPDGFSCIDTVVAILSDCCDSDTLVLIEWKSEWWRWSSRENELNFFCVTLRNPSYLKTQNSIFIHI